MKAVRITSSSAGTSAGEGTKAHRSLPAAALRASTRAASAASRSSGPPAVAEELSISSRETTSASRVLIEVTIFSCWRCRSSASQAPRGPLAAVQVRVLLISPPGAGLVNPSHPGTSEPRVTK